VEVFKQDGFMNYQSVSIARVFRGETVESTHWGSAAVVGADGRLLYRVGDPYLIAFMRSSSKPFQAIPVVESGAARRFEFTSKELAIITGSHSGEADQVDIVKSILDKIGLSEDHLQCGVHPPHRYMAMKLTPDPGQVYTRYEHNCSGKHAGMLAVAVHKGFSVADYLSPEHPVQQYIRKAISEICGYPEEKLAVGIDGCSAPNFALPLYNMALGFARLISPNSVPREKASIYSTIARAMMEHPYLVAGTGRFDTVVASAPGEPLIAKAGAEAVQCFAVVNRHIGAAIKITDGTPRALYPVGVEFLYKMGIRSKVDALEDFHRPDIMNWRQLVVGHIEPGFEILEVEHD
jgi:L-asparaginase II